MDFKRCIGCRGRGGPFCSHCTVGKQVEAACEEAVLDKFMAQRNDRFAAVRSARSSQKYRVRHGL